jgi:hypothetical protein
MATVKEVKKDFLGNTLNVGDSVVFVAVGGRELAKGKIYKLNPKQATIEYIQKYTSYNGKVSTSVSTPSRPYALIVKHEVRNDEPALKMDTQIHVNMANPLLDGKFPWDRK